MSLSTPQINEGLEKVHDLTTMPISLTHLVNEHKYKSQSPRYFILKSTAESIFELICTKNSYPQFPHVFEFHQQLSSEWE